MQTLRNDFYEIQFSSEFTSGNSVTAVKIVSFEELPSGWHYGEGGPIDSRTIAGALDICWYLDAMGVLSTDAFAGAGGEVLVTGYSGDHYFGVVIEADGRISFRHEIGDEEETYIECERDDIQVIKDAIKHAVGKFLAEKTWSMYDYFIQRISNQLVVDSMSYHSNVTEIVPSQSWSGNAWKEAVVQSADMLANTM